MQFARCLRGFVLLLSVAMLAGCAGSSATPNLSPVSAAPSTTASSASASATASASYPADVPLTGHNVRPGEKPPVYPAAAKAHSQAGANAFAEFFLKTLDWAYATTNPSYMKHYYGPTCGLCSGLATGITKTAAIKHWYVGDRLTLGSPVATRIGAVTAPAEFCSLATLSESAFSTVDARGKVYTSDRAHQGDHIKLCMIGHSGSWQISFMAGTA